MALYDPDGSMAAKRELAAVRRHVADHRKLIEHSPTSALGRLLDEFWRPMASAIERLVAENVRLAADNVSLTTQQVELLGRVERLEQDMAAVHYDCRAPDDLGSQIRGSQWS